MTPFHDPLRTGNPDWDRQQQLHQLRRKVMAAGLRMLADSYANPGTMPLTADETAFDDAACALAGALHSTVSVKPAQVVCSICLTPLADQDPDGRFTLRPHDCPGPGG